MLGIWPFLPQADIWSLGCLVFELASGDDDANAAGGGAAPPARSPTLSRDASVVANAAVARAGNGARAPAQVAVKWLLQEGVAVSARPTAEFGLGRSECRDDGSCLDGVREE